MKTITIDFVEYKEELDQEFRKGVKSAVYRLEKIITAIHIEEFSEALSILYEDIGSDSAVRLFKSLLPKDSKGLAWLKKEGLNPEFPK